MKKETLMWAESRAVACDLQRGGGEGTPSARSRTGAGVGPSKEKQGRVELSGHLREEVGFRASAMTLRREKPNANEMRNAREAMRSRMTLRFPGA